jgi:hypothetical protein
VFLGKTHAKARRRKGEGVHDGSAADRQKMLDLLKITKLRPGVNARTPEGQPGAANYDESMANPYPKLPDPLALKNGRKVTSAEMWWKQPPFRR